MVKQYGADILRLWVAQVDYTADQRIGPEILKGSADSYRRLRNTLRFMIGALDGFDEAERVEPAEMPELERWVLHRLAELDAEVRAGYGRYAFQHVFQQLFQFCTVDLSSVYFDIRKDALYCDPADSLRRRSARTVLDLLFTRLTTWLAPMLVFTMEEVWLERFPGEESSVHLVDFPDTPAVWRDEALGAKWAGIRRARRVVTGALEVERREKRIGASLEAAPVVHVADADLRAVLGSVDFADLCITSDLVLSGEPAPEGAFALDDVAGVAVVPDLAGGRENARGAGRCCRTSARIPIRRPARGATRRWAEAMLTLHIGLPKTGTTFLQRQVFAGSEDPLFLHRRQGPEAEALCRDLRRYVKCPGIVAPFLRRRRPQSSGRDRGGGRGAAAAGLRREHRHRFRRLLDGHGA